MATNMPADSASVTAPDEAHRARECARLNDLCRSGQLHEARTVFTRGCIDAFCDPEDPLSLFAVQAALAAKVRAQKFNGDDDPHSERDFGVFEHQAQKLFWKIDYYDPTLRFGSEDPTDLSKTHRVLTVLLASEY